MKGHLGDFLIIMPKLIVFARRNCGVGWHFRLQASASDLFIFTRNDFFTHKMRG
jgi:hypothetical protein